MRRWPFRSGTRLLLRIYLLSLAVLVAISFALGLAVNLFTGSNTRRDFRAERARYIAEDLGSHWSSPEDLNEALGRARDLGQFQVAVYSKDGTLRASTLANAPPVPEEVRHQLTVTPLTKECADPECLQYARIERHGDVLGYAVMRWAAPPPPFRPAPWMPLVVTAAGLLVAALLVARTLAKPLERLAGAARAFGEGDLASRSGIRRSDEIGQVARAFDEMADRITRLLQSHTELLANVAHELRTPLARIRLALELAAGGDLQTAQSSLAEIGTDLTELETLVSDILISARLDLQKGRAPSPRPPMNLAPLNVWELVDSACARLRTTQPARRLEVEFETAAAMVCGDSVLVRRVFDNLLDNARKYSDPDRPIRVRGRMDESSVEITIADEGIGIPPEDLPHLFTPFFRTDRSRTRKTGGVGLGLSLSRQIVEAHGGTLTLQSELGRGTTVRVRLPRTEDEARLSGT